MTKKEIINAFIEGVSKESCGEFLIIKENIKILKSNKKYAYVQYTEDFIYTVVNKVDLKNKTLIETKEID
jgi:hypothetical protein